MNELKDQGRLEGKYLLLHFMSNWRSQLDIEYKRWREQDEQAYKQIRELIETASKEKEYLK